MNKKLLKEKWSYITIFSFSKSFSEPCISEMIHLFYIFWDRRISVISTAFDETLSEFHASV